MRAQRGKEKAGNSAEVVEFQVTSIYSLSCIPCDRLFWRPDSNPNCKIHKFIDRKWNASHPSIFFVFLRVHISVVNKYSQLGRRRRLPTTFSCCEICERFYRWNFVCAFSGQKSGGNSRSTQKKTTVEAGGPRWRIYSTREIPECVIARLFTPKNVIVFPVWFVENIYGHVMRMVFLSLHERNCGFD